MENSRRAKALSALAVAEDAIAKSIMHLGGYTRTNVPKKNISTFVARKMLEGISLRLHATINLLNYGERPKAETLTAAQPQAEDFIIPITPGPEPSLPNRKELRHDQGKLEGLTGTSSGKSPEAGRSVDVDGRRERVSPQDDEEANP